MSIRSILIFMLVICGLMAALFTCDHAKDQNQRRHIYQAASNFINMGWEGSTTMPPENLFLEHVDIRPAGKIHVRSYSMRQLDSVQVRVDWEVLMERRWMEDTLYNFLEWTSTEDTIR